ncbi:VanZ family protein [Streptomyces ureilyticus]|uniref:VanZ family protein n=1 Tax=Streptomyces ureilyticus TaxID=1775131 RepID=A0ABX0DZ15_9ACTN|nr:VanZ family protein [Streptomyces ureilyticus]NGO44356.1 VanZ family protein [Streptomyces ureilyticus]
MARAPKSRSSTPKSGSSTPKSRSGTPKSRSSASKARSSTAKSRSRTSRTAKSGRKPAPAPSGRRPLPLVVRLLVLLVAVAAMVAFAAALAQITLQPSPASEALTHTNLRPGRSLRAYLDQPELRDAARQIGGNLLLGVPFGILLPVVLPRARGILRVLTLTAAVMLLVELVQGAMVTGRAFDIDDVLLNTTGAMVGYLLLGRRMGRAVHPRKPKGTA